MRGPRRTSGRAREIIHHLADSEMTSAIRLRLLLAEERPAIKGYDQEIFAKKLFYDRPYQASLEAFKYARETTGEILDRMTPADWGREGTHTEVGRYTRRDVAVDLRRACAQPCGSDPHGSGGRTVTGRAGLSGPPNRAGISS